MAVKRIRSKELEIAEKNNKTLEEVCAKYGVDPNDGLTGDAVFKSLQENFKVFCVKRGITEDAANYFISAKVYHLYPIYQIGILVMLLI